MRILGVLGALAILSGCLTMPEQIPPMAPSEIKTVAVVGYTIDVKNNDAKSFKDQFKIKMDHGKIRETPMSAKVYNRLIANLKKATNWKIASTSRTVAKPAVKVLYKKKNSAFKTGEAILPKYYERYQKTGVPQAFYVTDRRFDKVQLANALGVDAIVVYKVNAENSKAMRIGGFGVGGARYTGNINMQVYDKQGILVFSINSSGKGDVSKVNKAELPKFGNDKNALYSYDAVARALEEQVDEIKAEF